MNAKQALKKTLSWLAVLFGLALSVLGFGFLGTVPLTSSFHPPSPKTWLDSLTLLAFGAVPLLASLNVFRSRKIASLLCLSAAPLISLLIWLSKVRLADVIFFSGYHRVQYEPASSAVLTLVVLILLGYFWSIAHRYQWPQLVCAARLPAWAKTTLATLVSLLFLICTCAMSVHIASLWELPGDCGGPPAFSKAYPGHTVFIARVVHIDRITGAMGIVQQRFAGLPWWNKIVFLKFIQNKGTYFIDGRFEEGIVTRWVVPVLDLKCTGSSPIEAAGVELRLFRDTPRWNGVRIIGRVLGPTRAGSKPVEGAMVIIGGPEGPINTKTDRDGIYDVSGLPSGHYSIHIPASRRERKCEYYGEQGLNSGDVWGCDLMLW